MSRRLGAVLLVGVVSACATGLPPGPQPYLATYRTLEAGPDEIIAYSTASIEGRLQVVEGCFVVMSATGVATLVAFAPQVSVIHADGRWGVRDAKEGHRILEGEAIGVGGASAGDAGAFIRTRFESPQPPPRCPQNLFVSNAGFGRR